MREIHPPCIDDTSTQGYIPDGNVLTLIDTGDFPVKVEIQGNTLTVEGDVPSITCE